MTSNKRALGLSRGRLIAVAGLLAAGALTLTACSDDSGDGGMPGMNHGGSSSSAAAQETTPASFNDADVTFLQGMIPHHQQALEMAELAGTRAADQEIKDLAAQIAKAQDPEITTMTGWLKAWGKPTAMPGMAGMDHSGMSGMMSEADMTELKSAKGTAFDRAFAEMMIEHHNGAIQMAGTEQKTGKNTDAKQLADAIIKAQSTEITQFQTILNRL
ncbi:DUF305 domain-containing protein [Streptomyces sp. NPDC051940]|uniref:DUF305 domain-containing protein n=1 Tax=Streptomyces sp. NPDC051940 TaxID=3155675 RepID=UPI003438EF98